MYARPGNCSLVNVGGYDTHADFRPTRNARCAVQVRKPSRAYGVGLPHPTRFAARSRRRSRLKAASRQGVRHLRILSDTAPLALPRLFIWGLFMRFTGFVVAAAGLAAVQAASAADMPTKAPIKAAPMVAATPWTGFYVNGGVGYGLWAADTNLVGTARRVRYLRDGSARRQGLPGNGRHRLRLPVRHPRSSAAYSATPAFRA